MVLRASLPIHEERQCHVFVLSVAVTVTVTVIVPSARVAFTPKSNVSTFFESNIFTFFQISNEIITEDSNAERA